jgi:hypothetical protein
MTNCIDHLISYLFIFLSLFVQLYIRNEHEEDLENKWLQEFHIGIFIYSFHPKRLDPYPELERLLDRHTVLYDFVQPCPGKPFFPAAHPA